MKTYTFSDSVENHHYTYHTGLDAHVYCLHISVGPSPACHLHPSENVYVTESYGLVANDVLTGIMGAGDRQPEVRRLLDEFGRHFDTEDFDSAERALGELERLVGVDNPDVVAARSALAFERL